MTTSTPILAEFASPDDDLTFAQEAGADAFGRRWIHPADRDFRDRPPPGWQRLGDVATCVVDDAEVRMRARARRAKKRELMGA